MNPYSPDDQPAPPPAAPPPGATPATGPQLDPAPMGVAGPPGYQAYPGYYAYPPPRTNQNAMVALIISIVSLVTCPLIGLLGIYFGNRARAEIQVTGEQGEGMAQAGQIIGWITLGLSILIGLFVVLWFGGIFLTFFSAFGSL